MDEIERTLLRGLLKRPLRDWETACGIARPPRWCFWRWKQFRLCVEATREAIAATLNLDRDCPPCLPYVDCTIAPGKVYKPLAIQEALVVLTVHTWGRPWEV
jgi:hypothetical protein